MRGVILGLVLLAAAPSQAALQVIDPNGLLPHTEKWLGRDLEPAASAVGSYAVFSEGHTCEFECGADGCTAMCTPNSGLTFRKTVTGIGSDMIELGSDIALPTSIPLAEWKDPSGAFITGAIERFLDDHGISFGKLEFMKLKKGTKTVFVDSEGKARDFPAITIEFRHHNGEGDPGPIFIDPWELWIELVKMPNLPATVSAMDIIGLEDHGGTPFWGRLRVFNLQSVSSAGP